ncbi:MinD superfamily P-loop ATPase containing an inserted ferredoxin domain [Candidatus Syntrophocurvum alkaliphilum]|uniref:MinD superfamily P-loop ATPase containing an inserted ferredoxin domain n=1 Tax=Candidatus Syntrophocurvum alkaliphilum TaxID=2293317 RepID=A0A6I6DC76_9FIRM|nr:MinD superfamily P-loop ATPase containing an inserted ferredoxin domain [Candidatus Syntrophocurvum alkaliphilum]
MKIAVASGKGGTGKTFLAMCLAQKLAEVDPIVLDTDVEEPNIGLFLQHNIVQTKNVSRPVPGIDYDKCTLCGECAEVCNFNALAVLADEITLFPELCHSCGACSYLCPENAINEIDYYIGSIEIAKLVHGGQIFTGRLKIGEAYSPPLINAVKDYATNASVVIMDCPPGTTCPMIEAIRGVDFCILAVEPTPFGLHDLNLALEAVHMLKIPCGLVINKWDGDEGVIKELKEKYNLPVLGKIPFSVELASAYAKGEDVFTILPELQEIIESLLDQVRSECRERNISY